MIIANLISGSIFLGPCDPHILLSPIYASVNNQPWAHWVIFVILFFWTKRRQWSNTENWLFLQTYHVILLPSSENTPVLYDTPANDGVDRVCIISISVTDRRQHHTVLWGSLSLRSQGLWQKQWSVHDLCYILVMREPSATASRDTLHSREDVSQQRRKLSGALENKGGQRG